ncbi:P1 [Torilis crimson leaf virus]|uniref:P1 n=1 Tax=Torilis crimson leaf virus TaxID=1862685 RepID=A0A6H2MW49_9VIRU|nr:P1 [Torilis crimson leaf virus]
MSNLAFLKLFLVLCFSLSLSSSTTTTIWETDTFGFNRITSVNLSYGDLFAATTPGLIKGEGEVIAPPLLRASNAELTSQPYTTLTGAILKKICLDARNVSSKVLKASRECLEVFSVSGTAMLQTATESFLWMLVAIWWTAYLWAAKFIWILVTYFTIPVLALGTLTLITMVIYRAARWICSQLPMHFILFPLTIIKFIIGMRVRAKKTPIVKEKACEGYTTFSIPQTPPKNSVVEVIFKDGSHAGYATCVKLHNGHNGLLTAHHVCQDNDMAIHSLRNGAKIKLEQFKIFFSNSDLDVTIYMGPRSWESTLACSAVDMVCANRLAVCETRLFGFENNEWRSRNGKLLGTFEKKVSVLSNTVEGDSGSAYFHGKNVVGVHTGYPVTGENFNLMAPIPSIPGLTSSKLVFETTAPQGKIFDDELINYFNELCEEFSISEARSIMKNKKMINYEASVKKQNQGNGKRSTDCATNGAPNIQETKSETTTPLPATGAPSSPPSVPASSPSQEDMMGKILEALLNRMNLVDIETKIVEKVSNQLMKSKNKSRGKRGGKGTPEALKKTSEASTTGKYRPPHSRSPGSVKSERLPNTTTPNKSKKANGGENSRSSIQNWRQVPVVLVGPNSDQKQS